MSSQILLLNNLKREPGFVLSLKHQGVHLESDFVDGYTSPIGSSPVLNDSSNDTQRTRKNALAPLNVNTIHLRDASKVGARLHQRSKSTVSLSPRRRVTFGSLKMGLIYHPLLLSFVYYRILSITHFCYVSSFYVFFNLATSARSKIFEQSDSKLPGLFEAVLTTKTLAAIKCHTIISLIRKIYLSVFLYFTSATILCCQLTLPLIY